MTEWDIIEVNYMSCRQTGINSPCWWCVLTRASSGQTHGLSCVSQNGLVWSDGCPVDEKGKLPVAILLLRKTVMFWLLQLLATGPCLARLRSSVFLSLCPCLSIISVLHLSGLILFLCLHLSLLLLVHQMMYSRYGSSVTLVGPWRIPPPSLSLSLSLSSFSFVLHKRTQNCLRVCL